MRYGRKHPHVRTLPARPVRHAYSSGETPSRQAFEIEREEFTLGVEEELMVLNAETLGLEPASAQVLDAMPHDARFTAELPAAQLELMTPVCRTAGEIRHALLAARRDLRESAGVGLRFAGAGTHPFAAPEGPTTPGPRYEKLADDYQWAARRGLTWGLHVHVAINGCHRAVAVHDALRDALPLLAALAGNAPFHDGEDTGFHSVRPKLAEGFPRQGIPPAWNTWGAYADFVGWGSRAGAFASDASQLWWEVRLHPAFGTIEVRVCDQPATAQTSAGLAAVIQALVRHLAGRYDQGLLRPPVQRERIEENRWRALRYGLEGTVLDLDTGTPRAIRESIAELLTRLEPCAALLGSAREFGAARSLLEQSGGERQREVAAAAGVRAVIADHADRFDREIARVLRA